jgi:predicted PurR-regulated permease PerM
MGSAMTSEQYPDNKHHMARALEVSIHIGLIILLVVTCLLILRPFLPVIVWGVIIAISVYPGYGRLRRALGGRGRTAAVVLTVFMLAILIAPVVLLTGTVVDGVQILTAHLRNGTLTIAPPPPSIETWPVIGPPLSSAWGRAAKNLTSELAAFAPQVKASIPVLLSTSTKIGVTVLQFVLSILVAGVLLANARGGASVAHSLANRLFGDKGAEFEDLVGSTIRSVTRGILGVAFIQSILASLGFLVVRLPGAGFWAMIFLFAAVLQIGGIALIPAVIYEFTIASTIKATLFLIWCIVVSLMDNVLKPLLLGRGVAVPVAVIFVGAIGGFLAMGIIGLFVGPIVLSVGYKLSLAWLEAGVTVRDES